MLRAEIKQHCPLFLFLEYLSKEKRQERSLSYLRIRGLLPKALPKQVNCLKKKAMPHLAPVPQELLGKVTELVRPSVGAQGAQTPTISLPAAAV